MAEMASRICPEDVVCLASDPNTPGMVCCVGEDNENRSAPPTAHVYWLREHDNDRMEPITDLRILDRALLHGDTVIHNKRKGLVTATRMTVDMRYSDGTVVSGVDTKDLKHLQPFRQGNWVVAEGWLGRVLSCRDDVVVQFEDNSQCVVSATANGELVAVQKMYERSPYFPSMSVKGASGDTFKNAQWIVGSYNRQKVGVIASTRPAEVLVAWIAALQGSPVQPPPTSCRPESLALLNHFGHTWWRLGDRTLYAREGAEHAGDVDKCCEIVGTKTEVDIKYLDGTSQEKVPATSTLMFNPGPHEFYPGDLVCEKDPNEADRGGISVVLSADERSRMALTRRLPPNNKEASSAAPLEPQTCSAFDLVAHPDFSFRMGDVVLRLDSGLAAHACAHPNGTAHPSTGTGTGSSSQPGPGQAAPVRSEATQIPYSSCSEGDPDRGEPEGANRAAPQDEGAEGSSDRSAADSASPTVIPEASYGSVGVGTVGEVIDVETTGQVVVAWLGGGASAVHPEEIYRVALEEEAEDAMFYSEDGVYPAGQPQGANGQSLSNVPGQLLLQGTIGRVVLPVLNRIGSALVSVPILGSLVRYSADATRLLMAQLFQAVLMPMGRYLPLSLIGTIVPTPALSPATSLRFEESGTQSECDTADEDGASGGGEDGQEAFSENPAGEEEGAEEGVAVAEAAEAAKEKREGEGEKEKQQGGGKEAGEGEEGKKKAEEGHAGAEARREETPAAAKAEGGGAEEEEAERVTVVDDERGWEQHHYASRTEHPRSAGKFMMRVQKEWNLLRGSLPPDIFVVVYESRSDLMLAVIKGPQKYLSLYWVWFSKYLALPAAVVTSGVGYQGTPYADGLFFFDIQLPADYPDMPPRVYYHSHGDRLNPNLYENGKVCLSLLGTWAGSSVESWDPKKSNILQVLVSIQGLILVPEPYYNEPSYEQYRGTDEGERSSKQYNESALLLTLQSMLATIRSPPQHFAALVTEHYKELKDRILERCRAKLVEAKAECQQSTPDAGASLGFALSLERIIPKLETALTSLT